ncbi:MAG: hypothetical protein KC620_15855, partial [Myxococcales bacterium]|nr:hypothetical protein [Myxococcales bacterium]
AEADPLIAALPERTGEAVRGLLRDLSGVTLPATFTGESVLTGLARTADRVGLLAAGQLRAAAECLARHTGIGESVARGDDLAWAVRSGSRLRDLVKYALSDDYALLRRAAGLAL